ncbi:MAG: hypothetical protein K9N06_07635 [Candidatus Cloacimonetes bacterium]|nr:hypothetical protein [Candidatus Cloacimonadota bacterium]
MKRSIIVSFFLLFTVTLLMADFNLGFGVDLAGNQEISASGYSGSVDQDTNTGIEVFGEIINTLNKSAGSKFDAGIGAAWLVPRGFDDNNDEYQEAFSFIPLYFLIQLGTNNPNNMNFYGKAKIGYDLFSGNDDYAGSGDLTGGLYTGFGAGIISSKDLFLEVSYQTYNGSISWGGDDELDIVQTHISIMLGRRIK